MTLYEIESEIMDCIDAETGEIIDEERLTALQMERDKKISGVACWYKNLCAEAEAVKAEKMNLANRQKALENKAESLKKWLAHALNGIKYSDARVSISYRKNSSLEFDEGFDFKELPKEFQKITIEPMKNDIKAAIKEGQQIKGCHIAETNGIIIK